MKEWNGLYPISNYMRMWRPRKVKKNPRKYNLEGKSAIAVKKWISKNRHKTEAHKIFHSALRLGKIKKKSCKVCGNERVDGHHPDYSKPLKVIWLCRKHHKELHRKS